MNRKNWLYKESGKQVREFNTFPIAFREMFYAVNPALNPRWERERTKPPLPIDPKTLKLIAPTGREYSYSASVQMAETIELLKNGNINSREFKKR